MFPAWRRIVDPDRPLCGDTASHSDSPHRQWEIVVLKATRCTILQQDPAMTPQNLAPTDHLPEVCVVYIRRRVGVGQVQVLLGTKKTGLGQGRLVAPGGKVELGESPSEAAVREVLEETGILLSADLLTLVGDLRYPFTHHPHWSQRSWVFLADHPGGEPTESNELSPVWVAVQELPFDRMWDDAKYWLRDALDGRFTTATFTFGPDGTSVLTSDHASFVGRDS